MATDPDLLQIANDSGFPLQIALQHSVNAKTNEHGWKVRHSEHAWLNSADSQSGFIDLVLQDQGGQANFVIECKRVKHATWIFLNSNGSAEPRRHCKAWVTQYQDGAFPRFGWDEVPIDPTTPEAQFCAVRGQSTNDQNTMLERLAGTLISSTEALAVEERDYHHEDSNSVRFYFNAIVTTASLRFATFDRGNLSTTDGTLADATFQVVPFVRVRKQFSMRPANLTPKDWLRHGDLDYRRENTVFVINSDRLNDFLQGFGMPRSTFGQFVS